jgi:hypothetical protein
LKEKEYFYMRYMFGRIRDCWDRPICSRPGPVFELMGRTFDYSIYGTFTYTGQKVPGINLGSYNYLGFAENAGKCIDHVIDAVNTYGVGPAGRKIEVGTTSLSSGTTSSYPQLITRLSPYRHDRHAQAAGEASGQLRGQGGCRGLCHGLCHQLVLPPGHRRTSTICTLPHHQSAYSPFLPCGM